MGSLVGVTGGGHWWGSLVGVIGRGHWWGSLVGVTYQGPTSTCELIKTDDKP